MRVPAEPWGARRLWTTEVGERAGTKRDARRIDKLLRCAVEGRMRADVENAAAGLATHNICVRQGTKWRLPLTALFLLLNAYEGNGCK